MNIATYSGSHQTSPLPQCVSCGQNNFDKLHGEGASIRFFPVILIVVFHPLPINSLNLLGYLVAALEILKDDSAEICHLVKFGEILIVVVVFVRHC